ncbi:response regulator transcription factor [Microbacterium profundi]|uniref:Response regulator transcription factor n=1 Tax=Microbacterium profundi TaxID=450380 RepID=A0ABV3LJT5_9MICO
MTGTFSRPEVAVIVEDDPDIRSLLVEVFSSAGFDVIQAASGIEGVAAVEEHRPVITTLDVDLPGIDGFEAARRIRKISSTFIVMLSALADESDIVLGLGSGADEYLVKPFRPRELRARIEALMRRPRVGEHASTEHVVHEHAKVELVGVEYAHAEHFAHGNVRADDLTRVAPHGSSVPSAQMEDTANGWQSHRDLNLQPETHTVVVAQREITLTPTEFNLLSTLMESKRRVRSKSDLALLVRGEGLESSFYVSESDKRAIEAHIANLRRKIGDNPVEPNYIETVRGVGYRLTPQIAVSSERVA